jgi:hypothetical protein
VRIRSVVVLSVTALAALTLAGCSSSGSPSASPSSSASADLCSAKVKAGAASDSIKVSGDVGKEATATFDKPLDVTALQSTVVTEGKGDKLKSGDLVQFALTEFNAETGAKNGAIGQSEGALLPQQISASSVLGQVLGCATVGTRVVATIPGDETNPASVDVVDVIKTVPSAAWGTPQDPKSGFPTVKLAKNGEPTITIPKGAKAPTATEMETLKKGDGATVASGDTVLVQYTGVLWDTGKVFDSSWKNGSPAQFTTTGVVKGFGKALEGATVGSQVLVVIPPADGYGDQAQGSIPANSTLVFVVDVLGVQHAAAQ